ncbi:DUF5995 family protein [Puia sp.]|jgi:hypothetical protein|uniref:DUF5995 family protein n=1 Tax=Puia sp. TaxID=2045100 RepID=UPI002F41DBBD
MQQLSTIDEVLARLEAILADAQAHGKRTGYFAALYNKVTAAVKDGIAKGTFEDGPRMARLDVLFASRYLDALDCWENGRPLTDSWKAAFEASRHSSPLILQHLLLGINAHINLDLGIAAVETMGNQPVDGIHIDFNSINAILGSLTNEVIREIDHMSPLLSLMGLHANRTDSLLVQFSIGNARDGAWCFAEELGKAKGEAVAALIRQRDQDIARLAAALTHNSGLMRFTLWVIRLFEWGNARKVIGELKGRSKKFFSAKEL